MTVYKPVEHEMLMVQWWKLLQDSGELETTFYKTMHNLTGFLGNWANPNSTLLIDADSTGIALCIWFEPMMDGAWCGAWVRPDLRSRPSVIRLIIEAFEKGLEAWPVLMAWTAQPKVVEYLKRLGFKHRTNLPELWGGKPVAIATCERGALRLTHSQTVV